MSRFNILILLPIAIITTILPTLAADIIDVGDFVPSLGTNPYTNDPWSDNCNGSVKIIDDVSITIEGFYLNRAPWGQVIAFSKNDPYEGKWPVNGDVLRPNVDVRPLDAVFVKEGVPPDSNKCISFTDGDDDYKGTLKVKAVGGKKLTKETKFIAVYCLRYNILFCRVDVTGKLDGITAGDPATAPKCSSKYTDCWDEGGERNKKCSEISAGRDGGGVKRDDCATVCRIV